jgi:hypothetical protein
MRYLRTNTDTRITVGPFLDKTDGITPEVALTVTSEKLTFVVDTAGVPTLILDVAPTASGGANDMVHITNDDSGYYDLELAAANVNYLGRAMLSLNDVATHLPVFHEFMILPAVIYDAMILGTDLFDVSITQVNGAAQTATLDTIKAETVEILTDTAVIGTLGAGLTALATQTSVNTIAGYLDTEIAAILADTNELQVDWVNGGRLDLLIDAIKVPTDKLIFTVANQVDSNTLTQTADVHLTSNSLGDIWDHAGTITSLGVELLLERLYEMVNNKMIVTEATGGVALRNLVDGADVATGNVADLGATTVRAGLTWV